MTAKDIASFFPPCAYLPMEMSRLNVAVQDRVGIALDRSASGDRSAFGDLVEEHQGMVFSLAYHALGDSAAAEDVAQEVFFDLYRSLSSIKSPGHLKHWLRKTASHRTIDALRRRRTPEVSLDEVPEPAIPSRSPDPLLSRKLRGLVQTLPAKARMAVILRYQEEMELQEIAELLGMPVNSIKSSLHRSLGILREKISRSMGDFRV